MTSPLELNASGLQTETFEEIFENIGQNLQSVFGASLNTTLESLNGQYMRVTAELIGVAQETLLDVYQSFDPNSAVGTALDARAALTGSVRQGATNSTVEGLIEFGGPAVVPDGSLVLNVDQNTQWQTINGPYTDTGGPYPEYVAATLQAVNTGPLSAIAGTTWSIITVIPNFDGYTNPVEDATQGQNQETDAEFRYRRTVELFSQGQGPLAAIQAIVSRVNTDNGQVDSVRVYHNPLVNPADSDGIPWKAFNVVVETIPAVPPAGLQQDIFDAIWTATGAGGEAYGTDYAGIVIDTEGQGHPVAFDVISGLDIYQQITVATANTVNVDGPVIPADLADMATLIQTSVATAAQDKTQFNKIGRDYKELDTLGVIQGLITSGELNGIGSVTVELSTVSKTGPFTADFIDVGIRQRPDIDTGEIRVIIDGTVYIA